RLTIREFQGRFQVDEWLSPVMEYSRSILDEQQNILVVGRVYWAFGGSLNATERQDVDRIFRWIRYRTMPIPSDRRFRVFKRVCDNRRVLDYGFGHGFGILEPCPDWHHDAA